MPKPTRAEVEAVLRQLPAEQHPAFLEEVARRLAEPEPSSVMRDESGRALAIPQMPLGVELDPGTTEGKVNNAMLIASGVGGGLSTLGSIIRAGVAGGVRAIPGAAAPFLGRLAAYGTAGAAVGSLPIVGAGPREGATLGVMMALGQKGTGALWRHGKKKRLIDWITRKVLGSVKQADDVVEVAIPARMSSTASQTVPKVVELPRGTVSGTAKKAAAVIDDAGAEVVELEKMPDWVKNLGSKGQRARLESRGHVPGAMTADDVAAMKARGATAAEIEDALLRNAKQTLTPHAHKMGTIKPPKPKKATALPKAKRSGDRITNLGEIESAARKASAGRQDILPRSTATAAAKKATEPKAADIAKSIKDWKEKQKLSDAQIISSLREVYGVPAKDARTLLKLMFGG